MVKSKTLDAQTGPWVRESKLRVRGVINSSLDLLGPPGRKGESQPGDRRVL